MKREEEWKEIEKSIKDKDNEIIKKYGIDITKQFNESIKEENIIKRKKRSSIIKAIIILLAIILILIFIYTINRDTNTTKIERDIEMSFNNDIENVSAETNLFGNGFYVYRVKGNENIETHILLDGENLKNDLDARYYKYYFENWQDGDKDLFIVTESYEDSKTGLRTKQNWLLNYETYIEVSNYEEMIYATEAIIRFIEYIGNPNILTKSYIKVGEKLIQPHNSSAQTSDDIRKMAEILYFEAGGQQE